jgi:hypothetical protein
MTIRKPKEPDLIVWKDRVFRQIPGLRMPTHERGSSDDFHTDADIADLITDIQAQPSRFGPERIRAAFDYAKEKFSNRGGISAGENTPFLVDRGTHTDIYLISVERSIYDLKIIFNAFINDKGVCLKQNTSVDKAAIDSLHQRIEDFYLGSKHHRAGQEWLEAACRQANAQYGMNFPKPKVRAGNPIIVVPKGMALSVSRDVFEAYTVRLGNAFFGPRGQYEHPGDTEAIGFPEKIGKMPLCSLDGLDYEPTSLLYCREEDTNEYAVYFLESKDDKLADMGWVMFLDIFGRKEPKKEDGQGIKVARGYIREGYRGESPEEKKVQVYTCELSTNGPNEPIEFLNKGPKEMPLFFME